MSPRPYQLGKRKDQVDQVRSRVIEAARALLVESTSYTVFTIDAVAKRADVARATVYYQFGSKSGLLEALCDALAEAGEMSSLGRIFTTADSMEALRGFIAAFARFWEADRLVMRRLRALAVLDAEVGAVIAARDERNRQGLRVLLDRLITSSRTMISREDREELVRVLHTLTSFETFDSLAGERATTDVVPIVVGLAERLLTNA